MKIEDNCKINKIGLWGHCRVTKVELKKSKIFNPEYSELFISMFITHTHPKRYRAPF